ncbi:micronuclear linker histone polyprotein-like [Ambystoma mexicanum]|uniref:micronuclear linker histone polyprotein-like n=1 Tax=Ambystoma mexicanum TaxID=8296 RepID=UPI0037E78266
MTETPLFPSLDIEDKLGKAESSNKPLTQKKKETESNSMTDQLDHQRKREEIKLMEALLNYKNMLKIRETSLDGNLSPKQRQVADKGEGSRPPLYTPYKAKTESEIHKKKDINFPTKNTDILPIMSAVTIALAPFGKLYETINETLKDHTSITAACNSKLTHLEGYIIALEAWKASTNDQSSMTDNPEVFHFKHKSVNVSTQTNLTEIKRKDKLENKTVDVHSTSSANTSVTSPKRALNSHAKPGDTEKKCKNQTDVVQLRTQTEVSSKKLQSHKAQINQLLVKEKTTKALYAQKKHSTESFSNKLITKWITVNDQKPKSMEIEPSQNTAEEEQWGAIQNNLLDLSNLSVYSIETSESDIPRPFTKKRKVSFLDDKPQQYESKEPHCQIEKKKTLTKKKDKTNDSSNRSCHITPERTTLFRLGNSKINKTESKHGDLEESYRRKHKEKHNVGTFEETANNESRHRQKSRISQSNSEKNANASTDRKMNYRREENRRRYNSGESSGLNRRLPASLTHQNHTRTSKIFTQKSHSSRTLKLERSDKTGEKIILNRRAIVKLLEKISRGDQIRSADIKIVEFAQKARTDSIFLHITSLTVKKLLLQAAGELSKRGYLLRETTVEERGQRSAHPHAFKSECTYETNGKERWKPALITPEITDTNRTKRKSYRLSEKNERKNEEKKNAEREIRRQHSPDSRRDKGRLKSSDNSTITGRWKKQEESSVRKSNRQPRGPPSRSGRRESETRIDREEPTTLKYDDMVKKDLKKWAWIPSVLTRYVKK